MSNIVAFVFKAVDKMSGPLNKMTRAAAALKKRMASMSPESVDLSKNIKDLGKSVDKLSKEFSNMQTKTEDINRVTAATDKLADSVKKIEPATKKASSGFSRFRRKMADTGRNMKDFGTDMFTRITLPVLGIGAFLLKEGSDAEEATQKFNVVFKDVRTEATKTAQDLAKNFGISGTAAENFLSGTGDLLTGLKFGGDEALAMSKQIAELGVDLASFTNIEGGAERAVHALTSALLGEREAIKALGIKISEDMVNRKVALMISKGARFETLLQAKAAATLELALEQSKNAIGDYARSQGSLANRTRAATAATDDMAGNLGKLMKPVGIAIANIIEKLARKVDSLSPAMKKTAIVVTLVTAALPPLIIFMGALALAFGAITLPVTLTVAAIGAVIAATSFLIIKWDAIKAKIDELQVKFVTFSDMVKMRVVNTFNDIKDTISETIDKAIEKVRSLIDFITPTFSAIGDAVSSVFSGSIGGVSLRDLFGAGANTQRATTDVNINLSAPKDVVDTVESQTRGSIDSLNLGVNMQTSMATP